jgi:hypothetical protein
VTATGRLSRSFGTESLRIASLGELPEKQV